MIGYGPNGGYMLPPKKFEKFDKWIMKNIKPGYLIIEHGWEARDLDPSSLVDPRTEVRYELVLTYSFLTQNRCIDGNCCLYVFDILSNRTYKEVSGEFEVSYEENELDIYDNKGRKIPINL